MADIQLEEDSINIDAVLIGGSLGIDAAHVQGLMREARLRASVNVGL
jgi:heptaprenylglyceryl phosphate synthase